MLLDQDAIPTEIRALTIRQKREWFLANMAHQLGSFPPKYTQQETALMLGVSTSAVSAWMQRWARPPASHYLYAIQAESGGLVKIGHADNVEGRLARIQSMCPIPLVVRWCCPGTVDDEAMLHARFAARRRHGEWFDFDGLDLLAELNSALGG